MLAEVGAVPCGASRGANSDAFWVQAAVASNNTNSPVFFMLPPEKGRTAVPSQQLNARKERLQPEGNKQVRVGQGYEGVGNPRAEFFGRIVNPLLHKQLSPCNNSPFHLRWLWTG